MVNPVKGLVIFLAIWFIAAMVLFSVSLFEEESRESTCESIKGTCQYYGCMSDEALYVNHVTMYATQQLACLKSEQLELFKEQRVLTKELNQLDSKSIEVIN